MVSKSGNKIKLEQNTSKGKTSTSVNSTANDLQYLDTSQIKVPEKIADQIIGQEEGLKIMKKAALQRRHVLLIGEPGTGKSLIGQALAELLPATKLSDILCLPNDQDENNGPFYISDDHLTGISDPKTHAGKENGPDDTTDQLQGKKLDDFHIQDTVG